MFFKTSFENLDKDKFLLLGYIDAGAVTTVDMMGHAYKYFVEKFLVQDDNTEMFDCE